MSPEPSTAHPTQMPMPFTKKERMVRTIVRQRNYTVCRGEYGVLPREGSARREEGGDVDRTDVLQKLGLSLIHI